MQGSCLCGAVRIRTTENHTEVGVCHCDTCRRWNGGPSFVIAYQAAQLEIEGAEHIGHYASSGHAERAFCKTCGSHLYSRHPKNDTYMLAAGLFGEAEDLHLSGQVFIDKKPGYYELANDTPKLTALQFTQIYGPD